MREPLFRRGDLVTCPSRPSLPKLLRVVEVKYSVFTKAWMVYTDIAGFPMADDQLRPASAIDRLAGLSDA